MQKSTKDVYKSPKYRSL